MATLTASEQGYTDFFTVSDSSVIDEIVYDAFDRKLFVFLTSGSIAAYKDVDKEDYDAFVSAFSVGKHWNQVIKKKFRGISSDVKLTKRPLTVQAKDAFSLPQAVPGVYESFASVVKQVATQPVPDTAQAAEVNVQRRWLVTVVVEAPNLGVAVNDVVSAGFDVEAVNPQ